MEFLAVFDSPQNSAFDGKKLNDNPIFTSKTQEEKQRIILAIVYLSEHGWEKIKFVPERPFESVVISKDGQRTKTFKDFALWIRGPLADFMKNTAQPA